MPKFIIIAPVKSVNGCQQYECVATDEAEAMEKWKKDDCQFVGEEIEVTALGDPDIKESSNG